MDGAAGGEHELEGAVEDDLVALADAAQDGDPSAVVGAEVGLEADGLVRVGGVSPKDDGDEPVSLDGGAGDREDGGRGGVGDDLGVGGDSGPCPGLEVIGADEEVEGALGGVAGEAEGEGALHGCGEGYGAACCGGRRGDDAGGEAALEDAEIALQAGGAEAELVGLDDGEHG